MLPEKTEPYVMSGVNPESCEVFSFKQPSTEELEHDFLWRTTCRLLERGRIGIFNRSYYEEVLVVRVLFTVCSDCPIPPYSALFEFWSGVDSTAKNHTAPRPCPRELMRPSLFK
jgi:hypothetical protein